MNEAVRKLLGKQFVINADRSVKNKRTLSKYFVMYENTFISLVNELLEAQRKACMREYVVMTNDEEVIFSLVQKNILSAQIIEGNLK